MPVRRGNRPMKSNFWSTRTASGLRRCGRSTASPGCFEHEAFGSGDVNAAATAAGIAIEQFHPNTVPTNSRSRAPQPLVAAADQLVSALSSAARPPARAAREPIASPSPEVSDPAPTSTLSLTMSEGMLFRGTGEAGMTYREAAWW